MFLYSMIERLYRADRQAVDLDTLYLIARYKELPDNRRTLYRLIRDNRSWMGSASREIGTVELPEELAAKHHKFDAFLCALTAWAHDHGECISWCAAHISPEVVDIEGHILVLRQGNEYYM